MSRISAHLIATSALALALLGADAHAQSMPYGDPGDSDAPSMDDGNSGGSSRSSGRGGHSLGTASGGARTTVRPYIELNQSVLARLEPVNEVLTYSSVAVGVDVALAGRRTEGAVSLRYERRFALSGDIGSNDTISGLARVRHDLIPRTLTIEAGGLATRTRFDASGASRLISDESGDQVAQVYSVYAGPALSTHVGDVALKSSYLVGYTKVNTPRFTVAGAPAGQPQLQPQRQGDIFGHSVAQAAQVSAGIAPGTVLPIGITASGGYTQEDISNLDQRVRELRGGVQVTLPVNSQLALIAGGGYQDVKVSSRDAVRGPNGLPVIGGDGRYVTDKTKPRTIAYDVSGFTWDAGVMWKPSRRTSLSAFVGRRYDSMTYYGSFSYTPNARNALSINVFDAVTGFGSTIGDAVRGLPTDFTTQRNPFSGDISGCASGAQGGGCVNGALGSLASAAFRGRGVSANYSHTAGRLQMGLGGGYFRRNFIGARGTVLEAANGKVDETYYVNAGLSGPIDRLSGFSVNIYDSWFKSGATPLADVNAMGINAGISRQFTNRLVGNVAVGLDALNRKLVADELVATGQLGLRYNF